MTPKNILFTCFVAGCLSVLSSGASGQSQNYWTRSFNEESSLLSGAVVGGGSGPTSIYYNPANISEVRASKLSVNASLFSFTFLNAKNALGDGIDINITKGKIEPRFVSYMIKSKRYKNWSFEIAFLNNENIKIASTESEDDQIDILTNIPGDERYFAVYQFSKEFRDDWIGAGGSVKLSDRLYAGASMFVTIKSLSYSNSLSIEAYSLNDSIFVDDEYIPPYVASYENAEYLKFNDYRLVWKAGILYHAGNIGFGLSFTTPSLGGIYSDGKRDYRIEQQSNITMPGTGEPVPDYVTVDYKEKKDMNVSYKTPFSASAGLTYDFPDGKRTFYTSVEFFSKTNPYFMVEAEESSNIGTGNGSVDVPDSAWLSYVNGARPVFNFAFGYKWTLKPGLLLMGGFRSDFNYLRHMDYDPYSGYNKMLTMNMDLYHITCGLSWKIRGQDFTTGFQYSVGHNKDQRQLANLSDPIEYNPDDHLALQGISTYDMSSLYNSIIFYLGASFNFGEDKK